MPACDAADSEQAEMIFPSFRRISATAITRFEKGRGATTTSVTGRGLYSSGPCLGALRAGADRGF